MNSKSHKLLKNTLLAASIMLFGSIAHAQSSGSADSTHRMHHWGGPGKPGDHKDRAAGGQAFHGQGRGGFGHGRHGNGIHYTPEQRKQLMAINKEYHQKSADLFKKDNITLKEYKAGLVALQKDKKAKTQALLTPQQQEQMAQRKKMFEENRQVAEAARMERLKLHLNLSDDQVTKIKAGQADLSTQFKSIHENDNLLPQQKMEQMKGLMAKRKDVYKSVLTPDQLIKFEEMSHKRGFDRGGRGGHEGPGGRGGWDRGRHAIGEDGADAKGAAI
jgi:Spy/CpxP family protein refolding chaperone